VPNKRVQPTRVPLGAVIRKLILAAADAQGVRLLVILFSRNGLATGIL
jgi:hypothetical protein